MPEQDNDLGSPHRFVDEQVRGPYRVWIHEHRFTESGGGTSCEDSVQYAPLSGALVTKLFVERDIRRIFAYRSDQLQKIFGEIHSRPLGPVKNPTASRTP